MSETGRTAIALEGEAAHELRAAELSGLPTQAMARQVPGLDLDLAYRIQQHGIGLRLTAGGRPVGHKIGLTSAAMQRQMGVSEPDSGVLLADMQVPLGGDLLMGRLLAPRVEAEIAVRLGADLAGPHVDLAAVRAAVSEVFLALEVIDTRYGDWQITLEDSVADNASAARFVTGPPVVADRLADLGAERIEVHIDDALASTGYGRDVLGDPLRPLVWLAQRLTALGSGLSAGDVVLPGSVHASIPLQPGTTVRASSPHLPPVWFRAR
ncbi:MULTISPECIES: fumarylacetoacetate hydrolase family protein [Kitasatospora]|uniref:Putative 2-hydroxypenta-2,4-dienoate hydratase n=1 Tax=Kitasatospora setae (strain ATCC 33774 / DSM 43861 / JCM 3304 / KCC A-0304 / NBRC 14216 / KM-6054) TaxID=452652 RepID=E4NAG0_KITSK|nr:MULTISPECIES: fumarylacetoacetate hydrolase family protein [Kitasatospora]BAJ28191.1 putative 2-hydroxypenta-2,4-dienoate hydratase [Kitasatospora setae KM-6054]